MSLPGILSAADGGHDRALVDELFSSAGFAGTAALGMVDRRVLTRMLHAIGGIFAHEGLFMPHIALNSGEPGIRGFLPVPPETGRPLSELAEGLLRGPGTPSPGEPGLIAAYV